MKKYISLIALLSLFVIGCQENNITQPYSENSNNSNVTLLKSGEPNWIGLPDRLPAANYNALSKKVLYSISKDINGNNGGELRLQSEYAAGPFGKIKVDAKIKFPKGAYEGEKFVTMSIEQNFGSTTFSPHSNFNFPADYDLKYEGLDLTGLTPSKLDFVYMNEDGTYEQVVYDEISMDVSKGKIEIKNAKLPHFSRYGFVRKDRAIKNVNNSALNAE